MTFEENQKAAAVIAGLSDEGLQAAIEHELDHVHARSRYGIGMDAYSTSLMRMLRAEQTERMILSMHTGEV